jgi:hypothetical protein
VLDTNVVILTRRLDPAALPGEPTITTVTLANALPLYTTNGADFAGIDGLEAHAVSPPA